MIDVVFSIFKQISSRLRQQFWLLTILIAVSGLVEMLALGSIALFMSSLASLDSLLQSQYLVALREVLGGDFLEDRFSVYMALGGSAIVLFF